MSNLKQYSFQNKRALIRVDFNVPLDANHCVTDNTRIKAAIPTIEYILTNGGAVILMSHLGRPSSGPEDKYSLYHIVPELSRLLGGKEVKFADDCISEEAVAMSKSLKAGEVLLLENLRFYAEEKKGDAPFAHKLARLGDVYVNDAFGTAHRAHASTAVIAQYFPNDKLFGDLLYNEIQHLDKVLHSAEKPFTAILGGAKVSDKIGIIEHLMDKVQHIIIGGGMMFTFVKAMGGEIGKSLVEEDLLPTALALIEKAKAKGVQLHLPTDVVAADAFANDANTKAMSANVIEEEWMGLDIGLESRKLLERVILESKTILWNGPMGVFEMETFAEGTKSIAQAVAKATEQGAFSLIGGGDSVAAINKYNLANRVSYVSTGGGAMLEYMEGKQLPGIEAIKQK